MFIKRVLLLGCGWLCVTLGVIGIFLPLLPTTPFLLLASACFMRGSPRISRWLHHHPHFGPILQNWHQHGGVSSTVKRRANCTIVLSFLLSIYLVPLLWHKVMLIVIASILLFWFNRLPVIELPSVSTTSNLPSSK
ncbi:YbaN family protein [Photobacterium sp. SDRW27]|uniref:YbaN family protein n=1 Tax=Photobacterium obscurum TaxID=2829490 RepID=UPI0022443DAE|nr:YbaN family protein [Photobacterium obscurum]MCW8327594.1 YbaN family protein [Photobacterium obscurum]